MLIDKDSYARRKNSCEKKMKISKTKIHFVTAGRNIVFSLEWYFFNFV